jgi:carbamoylphosphate synthase large subunit
MSACYVANELGMPGYDAPDVAAILHNKRQFRAYALKSGMPCPKTQLIGARDNIDSFEVDFPCLVKPADSFSGRGIVKLDSGANMMKAVQLALTESKEGRVVLEQLIEGTLHSHSAFLKNRKILTDFFVDEFCEVYPYQVDCSNSPSRISSRIRKMIRECILDMASDLKLKDGLIHTQFIVSGSKIYIIECMRRCPGDLLYNLVSRSTGADYVGLYAGPYVNKGVSPKNTRSESWARHTVSLSEDAVVWAVQPQMNGRKVAIYQLEASGSLIRRAPYGKVAILFCEFPTRESLFQNTQDIGRMVDIQHTKAQVNRCGKKEEQ